MTKELSDEVVESAATHDIPVDVVVTWDELTEEFLAKHCYTERCRFKTDLDTLNTFAKLSPKVWSTMVGANDVYVKGSGASIERDPSHLPPSNIGSSLFVVNEQEDVTSEVFSNSLWEPGSSGHCKMDNQTDIRMTTQVACLGHNCDPHKVCLESKKLFFQLL